MNHSTTYRHLSPKSYSTQFHSSSSLYSTVSLCRSPSLYSHQTRPSLRRQNRVPCLVHRRSLMNYSVTNASLDRRIVVPSPPIPTQPPTTEPLNFTDGLLDQPDSLSTYYFLISFLSRIRSYRSLELSTWTLISTWTFEHMRFGSESPLSNLTSSLFLIVCLRASKD